MYDELVKALRNNADHYDFVGENGLVHLLVNAADAIENVSKAYRMMAEAYESEVTKPRWIPVAERLPEERTDVLAMTADCDIFVCDFIPLVKQFWTIPGDDLHIDDITHWMPLPEPPKEGET